DRYPRDAVVLRLPDAAARRAHVEHVRLRPHADRRSRAPAAMRADRSPSQVLIQIRIDDGVAAGLRARGRHRALVSDRQQRHRNATEQEKLVHGGSSDEDPILLPRRDSRQLQAASADRYDARSQRSIFDRAPPYGLYSVGPLPTTSSESLSP